MNCFCNDQTEFHLINTVNPVGTFVFSKAEVLNSYLIEINKIFTVVVKLGVKLGAKELGKLISHLEIIEYIKGTLSEHLIIVNKIRYNYDKNELENVCFCNSYNLDLYLSIRKVVNFITNATQPQPVSNPIQHTQTTEIVDPDNNIKLHDEKRLRKLEKEKIAERNRIYESDLNTYYKIKEAVTEGRCSENSLPELFINKYPIFKFMDLNNLFDDNQMDVFTKLYEGMDKKDNLGNNLVAHPIFSMEGDGVREW